MRENIKLILFIFLIVIAAVFGLSTFVNLLASTFEDYTSTSNMHWEIFLANEWVIFNITSWFTILDVTLLTFTYWISAKYIK